MTETTRLVLGGTGKTGRRVAERLSRSAPVLFDWERPATWAATGVSGGSDARA
jgi:uncharacterized protein YbjT (DUF2867 family)